MALQKSIEVGNTGLFCDYIKVMGILFEAENNIIQVQLGIFASAQASIDGKEPVQRTTMSLELDDLSKQGDIREQVYNALKLKETFSGALDV